MNENGSSVLTQAVTAKKPPVTWPLFRFFQRDFASRWEVGPAKDDEWYSGKGAKLAGPYRDASALSQEEQDELLSLIRLARSAMTPEQTNREADLMRNVHYLGALPPIDVDVAPGTDPSSVLEAVSAIDRACDEIGIGRPRWASTGGKGYHGDQRALDGVRSPYLLKAYGGLVKKVAAKAGISLTSENRSKEGRPSVVVDDTLFERQPDSRGVVWRLLGSTRVEGGTKHTITVGDAKLERYTPAPRPIAIQAIVDTLASVSSVEGWKKGLDLQSIAESADYSEVAAEATGVRLARRSARKANVAPDLGSGFLKTFTPKLRELSPPSGARHNLRLAIAGWIIEKGVNREAAIATLGALWDKTDAVDAVTTTTARLAAGSRVFGYGRVVQILGHEAALELETALAEDLLVGGASPGHIRYLTRKDRQFLELNTPYVDDEYDEDGHKLARKRYSKAEFSTALRRAARCGFAKQGVSCEGCEGGFGKRRIVAESPACVHCGQVRAESIGAFIKAKWTQRGSHPGLEVAYIEFPEEDFDTATAHVKAAKGVARAYRNDTPDGFMHPAVRYIKAPGFVMAIHPDIRLTNAELGEISRREEQEAKDRLEHRPVKPLGPDDPKEFSSMAGTIARELIWKHAYMTAEQLGNLVGKVLLRRPARILKEIQARDVDALYSDKWIPRLSESSGSKQAAKLIPWPKKKDLRDLAAAASRARRGLPEPTAEELAELSLPVEKRTTPCCNAKYRYTLLGHNGEPVESRVGKPYDAHEAYFKITESEKPESERQKPWDGTYSFEACLAAIGPLPPVDEGG